MKWGKMKAPGGFPNGNYDGNAFGVMHYAAGVTYACDNWWEQNKSTLPMFVHAVVETSTWEGRSGKDRETGRYMMAKFEETRGEGTGQPATIGSQFRMQLVELVDDTLEASKCTCQFVRCIKPNKDKFSRATAVGGPDNAWQSAMVLNQLRYTGMLDTLMIRKKGFPTRPDHATFWKKFQILSPAVPKTDVKLLFDNIAGQIVPPADKPDLFKESHYYWGTANGDGPMNNKAGNGPARVMMKDATYRYLEKQVTETREKFVTVLASVSRAAHLCAEFGVAKTAAKLIAPAAVQFVKWDKAVTQAEIPKMEAEKSSMTEFKMLNETVEKNEQKERAQMFKEEQYIDKYMEAYAEERYKVQKVKHMQTAEDALAKCKEFMVDFEAQLANSESEPEPMDDTAFLDASSVPKFKWVKASANRPPRRAGSTKHRFKFAPKKTMI